ncbi:MAG: IclR family transcriptional regulator [Lachnospiraceae bacterium]|nr:IclR family transcriptional regulator [Lachnospiraceae bacterium]
MQEKEPQYINSIMRATAMLELYEKLNVQYLGIAEISRELKLQKTTTFNIVKTLMHQGWLVQDNPNGKYRLGTRILRVATMITRSITTEGLIVAEMHRLRDKYNEDAVLTAMTDGVPICVEKVQSANFLQIQSKVGRTGNLVKGSTGKTLLAWQPEAFIRETLEHTFPETDEGKRERAEVESQLKVIRSQGFCISISEQDEGVASVSVPILDGNGHAAYSLAIIGEEKRMKQKGLEVIQKELMETAKRLSEEHQYIRG